MLSNVVKTRNFIIISRNYIKCITTNTSLLNNKAYIDGEWVTDANCETFPVVNPATGEEIGRVPDMGVTDVQRAIQAAHAAFPKWSILTAKSRSIILKKWYNLIQKHQDNIAEIITLESGKPLLESKTEVTYGSSFVEWYAEEGRRITGEVLQSPILGKEMLVIKQPIGVVSIVTPWNFPCAMLARKASAALVAGCTCVIKPAEDTPLTALALCDLAEQAGFPRGVINCVTSSRSKVPTVGKELCQNILVSGLSFTGSTKVGKILNEQCSIGIKRIGLELGGNAPFIVFSSADIETAVDGAFVAKFRNCGQACTSPNRFLIHEDIYDEFVEKLKVKFTSLKLGNGLEPNTNLGPLINKAQVERVERIVNDAVSKGANVLFGGHRDKKLGNLYFMPTLLTNITSDMLCSVEEIFGPIIACIRFENEDEVVSISNNTRHGLAGYFYSNDISQIWRVAKRLEVGMVGINTSIISTAEAPFGGVKESGIGREGSHHGINEFVHIKYICFGNL